MSHCICPVEVVISARKATVEGEKNYLFRSTSSETVGAIQGLYKSFCDLGKWAPNVGGFCHTEKGWSKQRYIPIWSMLEHMVDNIEVLAFDTF